MKLKLKALVEADLFFNAQDSIGNIFKREHLNHETSFDTHFGFCGEFEPKWCTVRSVCGFLFICTKQICDKIAPLSPRY
ncbi:uncharacterized protein LOC135688155 [Rhopilema esculentum]|uniref:uncharacterized protein LOC135688155 n=1 Tax=Rhopilema esculentum TaxID=499914 RepID=UPI0031D1CF06